MATSATLHTSFQIGVPSTKSPCVLLVEDDAGVQHLERVILEEHGYQVSVANNGEEALDALGETAPDLILLDVELGGIDGFTTCQRIRQISDVPILMVTSRDSTGDKIWGLEVGADDYLTKPFHPDELAARVKVSLRRPKMYGEEAEESPESENLPMPVGQDISQQLEATEETFTPAAPDAVATGRAVDLDVTGTVRQMLSFAEQVRQDGRFRLFRLVANKSQGMELQIGLREPVHLLDVLQGMKDVGQVLLLDDGRYGIKLQ